MGSSPQCVQADVQGVPAEGIIDSGADITIMDGKRRVSAVAKLRKCDLMNPDQIPRNYSKTRMHELSRGNFCKIASNQILTLSVHQNVQQIN